MSNTATNALTLLGRLALATLFLPAGLGKIAGFGGTVAYVASAGLPLPTLGALIAIGAEVGGGLALIAGFQTRLAALGLAGFTLVASVFFHAFWSAGADHAMVQQLMFFKNVAIAGGLLVLAANGPGGLALDARRSR